MTERAVVFVVDDDAGVRSAVDRLLRSLGLTVRCFATAGELLEPHNDSPACVVLDVQLPGANGLEVQRQLAVREPTARVVFIPGHGDIPMSVQAIKAGAVDFLPKPFRDEDLADAVLRAVQEALDARRAAEELDAFRQRYESLTPRERQVLDLVVTGMLNKEIASSLGISEATVKIHRGRVNRKLRTRSVPELVRLAEQTRRLSSA